MATVRLYFNDGSNTYTFPYVFAVSDPEPGMKATIIKGNRGDGSLSIPGGKKSQEIRIRGKIIDDTGYKYNFINWEGDPAGGHHRSGILIFEPLRAGAKSLKLTLFNVNNLDRVFEWNFF